KTTCEALRNEAEVAQTLGCSPAVAVQAHQEWWLSGRKRRFAKPMYGSNRTAGSNPVLSARHSGTVRKSDALLSRSPCHHKGFCHFLRLFTYFYVLSMRPVLRPALPFCDISNSISELS